MRKTENVDTPSGRLSVSGVVHPDHTIFHGSLRVNYHNFIAGGSEKPHIVLAVPDPASQRTLQGSMTILCRLLVVSVGISLEIYVVSVLNEPRHKLSLPLRCRHCQFRCIKYK